MDNCSRDIPVSIYFTWNWWEEYYQKENGRPERIDFDWLDASYLGRQRLLYKYFGQFGLGSDKPVLDKNVLSMILPLHTVIVPAILGMKPTIKAEGGYHWDSLSKEQMAKLKPIDIADTPIAELLVNERDTRLKRYGRVSHMIDLASVTNNAFLLRGPDLYMDLIISKEFAWPAPQNLIHLL